MTSRSGLLATPPAASAYVRSLAWGLWVVAALLTLMTLFLFYLNWETPVPASWSVEAGLRNNLSTLVSKIVNLMIYTVLSATIGAMVAMRRPHNPIGWLLCLAGCASGLIDLEQEYTIYANFTAPGSVPGGPLAALIMNWLWVSLFTFFFWMMAIFPEGRLPSPRWRWLFWANAAFTVGVISASFIEQPMGSAFNLDNPLPVSGLEALNRFIFWLSMLVLIVIVVGITALMVSRFRQAQGEERQQLKWLAGAALLTSLCIIIGLGLTFLLHFTGGELLITASLIFLPTGIGIAILRYRLYDIDLIIRRTLVYGALIGGLALAYFGGVALLQFLSRALTGPQSDLVVVAITLTIAALFNPLRRRFQEWIDRAFYREKVDFRQAFTTFAREVRTLIDLPELLRVLVTRTTDLLHINHGAVFLAVALEEGDEGRGEFRLAEGRNLPPGIETLVLNHETAERLRESHPVSQPKDKLFPLLVPLIAPAAHNLSGAQTGSNAEILIGVLALGPRLSEQDYDREDQTLLLSLADQAGTAIYVAQLIQEKQAEAARREETERQLEAYRHSPMGRAETLAQALIGRPETALLELHSLAQDAEHDPDTADLLEHLTRALGYLGANLLTGLADGYHFIFNSQSAPELLPVGLRLLIDHLSLPAAAEIQGAAQALPLYRLCQQALEANAISQITHLLPELQAQTRNQEAQAFPPGLDDALSELTTGAEALHAYERVDTPQDKLAYLASAVERLSHLDRLARTELGSADRPIIQRVAAGWLAVVTGAMSDLQTRSHLTCQLLTRHTWAGEIISLALNLRNEGRGAALNLRVSLVPAPEYTLLDETGQIERLSAGEERQVELRVRPRLAQGISQFRARFIILYDDPRGPDQIEHFADVVYLLADEGEFKFIPNPYVVGTPLQTGSTLFFGREDVIAFIQENLSAAHQNNLVLIGQRRTGKTSLLKQLPARLGDGYVPVYLDGQSLALDPGLPSFFFSLATEITFALEDRGLGEAPASLERLIPTLEEFAGSPAVTFEHKFLAEVRQLIGERHLLLLLDEFEELEAAVRRGNIDASIFGFLRHLIQHTANLSVIFCGTHRLEELAADYWSVLFNISLYRHVAFLNQAEAVRLVQEPVASYGMRYDDLALDKMWRVTAGHPYFLQLLCHSLVNRHNKTQRNYVTVADVNAALDEMLASGEAHFVFLWTESSQDERLVLTALSRMMPLTGQVKPAQVTDYLAERGANLDRQAVSAALHRLALRDILRVNITEEASANSVDTYHWQLGLLGLWVEKYKSLSRVVEERKA